MSDRSLKSLIILILASTGLFFVIGNVARASSMPPPGQVASPPEQMGTGGNKISAELQAAIKALPPGDMLTVIVTLNDQVSSSQLTTLTPPGVNRATRQKIVIEQLRSKADVSQRDLKQWLNRFQGQVSHVEYFWIFNGLAVTATPEVVQQLAARPEVQAIELNATIQAPPSPTPTELNLLATPGMNLQNINATELWTMGITGQGIVVANLDSGVDMASHPDLAAKWRGGSNSWFDPYGQNATPKDLLGHGTATMGIMVGGENNGQAYGVAPGAQWIAAKVFNNSGQATTLAIHQALQWVLDPDGDPNTPDAPHVVENSWTWAPGCNYEFRTAVQNLRAAGILPIFAAGNNPSISYSPANYPEAFAVGAVDNSDIIWIDSSRGPSGCDSTIYPEIVAPGVSIYTSDAYGFFANYTGTSMSVPHVAGALALLLSASPQLTVDEQEAALLTGVVDLGNAGADNTYGNGRLDVLESLVSLGNLDLAVTPVGNIDVMVAGRPYQYVVNVANHGPADATGVTLTHTISTGATAGAATTASGVTLGSISTSQGNCGVMGDIAILCNIGPIDFGAAVTVTVSLTSTSSGITVTHSTSVSAVETDFNRFNSSLLINSQVIDTAPFSVFLPVVIK